MTLPHCIHRGPEVSDDRYICATDRLVHGGTVKGAVCRDRCHVVNKPLRDPKGFGDSVHRMTHCLGVDKLVEIVKGDCGCAGRKAWLNRLLPYSDSGVHETKK